MQQKKLSAAEYKDLLSGKKKHKYGAEKTSHAGYSFASKGEARLFDELKLREAAGEISDIQVQDTFYLTAARIKYIADYSYTDCATGQRIAAEYKGFETPEWRIKRRLWEHYGPMSLVIYYATGRSETLIPKTDA